MIPTPQDMCEAFRNQKAPLKYADTEAADGMSGILDPVYARANVAAHAATVWADTKPAWSGQTAEAFAHRRTDRTQAWNKAADAWKRAAEAMNHYITELKVCHDQLEQSQAAFLVSAEREFEMSDRKVNFKDAYRYTEGVEGAHRAELVNSGVAAATRADKAQKDLVAALQGLSPTKTVPAVTAAVGADGPTNNRRDFAGEVIVSADGEAMTTGNLAGARTFVNAQMMNDPTWLERNVRPNPDGTWTVIGPGWRETVRPTSKDANDPVSLYAIARQRQDGPRPNNPGDVDVAPAVPGEAFDSREKALTRVADKGLVGTTTLRDPSQPDKRQTEDRWVITGVQGTGTNRIIELWDTEGYNPSDGKPDASRKITMEETEFLRRAGRVTVYNRT